MSSCSKKSASNRLSRPDADIFFAQPTMQEYKNTQTESLSALHSGHNLGLGVADFSDQNLGAFDSSRTFYKHKILDVPLPVDAYAIKGRRDYITVHELSLARYTSLSQQALYDFYVGMFEQASWRLAGQIKGVRQSLMVWEKLHQLCVVSMEQVDTKKTAKSLQKTRIIIHICAKKNYA